MNDDHADAILVCDNAGSVCQVRAHQIILAASSEYFKAELKKSSMLILEGVNPEELVKLLEFMYCGQVSVQKKNDRYLSELARKFQIHGWPDMPEEAESRVSDSDVKADLNNYTAASGFESSSRCLQVTNPKCQEDTSSNCREDTSPRGQEVTRPRGQEDTSPRVQEDANPITFSTLPTEILLKILSYVPTQDLLINVALVSRPLSSLTKDPDAHLSVSMPYNVQVDRAQEFIRSMPKIVNLKIFTYTDEIYMKYISNDPTAHITAEQITFCDDILMAIAQHSNLRSLSVSGLKVTTQTFCRLTTTRLFQKLEKLNVQIHEENPAFRGELERAIGIISAMGKLRHFSLKGISFLNPDVFVGLAKGCTDLHTIILDANIPDNQFRAILDARQTTIKKFSLKYTILYEEETTSKILECKNLVDLHGIHVPYFAKLKDKTNMKVLGLNITSDVSPSTIQESIAECNFENVHRLLLFVDRNSSYPDITQAFPNLNQFIASFNNADIETEHIRKMLAPLTSLEVLCLIFTNSRINFHLLDCFDGKFDKLKVIFAICFGRSDAKKLFKRLPSLELVVSKEMVYAKASAVANSLSNYPSVLGRDTKKIVLIE